MDKPSLDQLLQIYLDHCRFEKRLDSKTLKAYRIDIEQFHSYLHQTNGSYSTGCLQEYIANLQISAERCEDFASGGVSVSV